MKPVEATDAVLRPLAESGPEWMPPQDLLVHPDLQFRQKHTSESGVTEAEEAKPVEAYDVDRGGVLLAWRSIYGSTFVVDGHHRRRAAAVAKHFVSSRLIKGELVPVSRLIPVRVLHEAQGWTLDMARKQGEAANKGEELRMELGADAEAVSDALEESDAEVLAVDGLPAGVLMRVRQYAAEADRPNKNRRRYPKRVLQAAIDAAAERVRAGVMLSEFEHPEAVSVCDRGRCGDAFVNDDERKTARVVEIQGVDSSGKVHIVRDILDTPSGREVAEKIRAKRPFGISTRWKMRGLTSAGDGVSEPSWLYISTFDDVRTPAVEGAGAVADSIETVPGQMQSDPRPQDETGLGDPFQGEPRNTVNPPCACEGAGSDHSPTQDTCAASAQEGAMNPTEIRRRLREFQSLVKAGACKDDIEKAEKAFADAIKEWHSAGEDVSVFVDAYQRVHAAADAESIPGFMPGRSGPYVQLGNELGSDPTSGWAPDVRARTGTGQNRLLGQGTNRSDLGADEVERLRELAKREADTATERARVDSVTSRLDELVGDSHPLTKLDEKVRDRIRASVIARADSAADVEQLLNDHIEVASAAAADARLKAAGHNSGASGETVNDPANPTRVTVVREARPGQEKAEKLLAASDAWRSTLPASDPNYLNPNDPSVKRRREINKKKMEPIFDQVLERASKSGGASAFGDSVGQTDEGFFNQVQSIAKGDAYSTTVASLANQPVILQWLLMQGYWDMRMLEFVSAAGPGQEASLGMPGWEDQAGLGRVFKVPSETYSDPSGYGFQYGPVDMGLLTPANTGITEGSVRTYWDTFYPQLRQIATSADFQSIRAMGSGPLNYSVIARNLFHMGARKSRTIDLALSAEIVNTALEYGAVAVSAESYTTGNSRLPNNSAYPGSGAVTVNLNPTKTAVASVAATDKSITYGTGNGSGGAAVVAAIRLLCGTSGTISGTSVYCGSNNIYGPTPVVPPRAQLTLTSAGADSSSTLNGITVTAPGSAVQGVLGSDGNIYSLPGTTATYAVDYLNGVLVFASGVTGSGGVMTTTTTLSYSYATNFDYFIVSQNMATIPTGQSYPQYLSGLLGQIDTTAARMGSWPRFVSPDLGLMGLQASTYFTQATQFFKLNSPDGTELYPDETHFARRNGIDMARLNVPWWVGDNAIILTRNGATKYAIDAPLEVKGPYPKYDSNGLMIAGEGYYGCENSAIFTPQTKDVNGATVNPVSRAIVLY